MISASAGSRYLAVVAVLNTCIVHDLNGLDTYTLYTEHQQDLVVARYKRTNYTSANACKLYST